VRKRVRTDTPIAGVFRAQKLPQRPRLRDQQNAIPVASKITEKTCSANNYHDYCDDDGLGFDNSQRSTCNMAEREVLYDDGVGMDPNKVDQLDYEIAAVELQVLNKRRALQRRMNGLASAPIVKESVDYTTRALRSYGADVKARRRQLLKQQVSEGPLREIHGKTRYTVDVDMKGHPCDHGRSLWLMCFRGYSNDIDFSVDNYQEHNTSMLLNVKEYVDSTLSCRESLP
jgi:hypothetical protein